MTSVELRSVTTNRQILITHYRVGRQGGVEKSPHRRRVVMIQGSSALGWRRLSAGTCGPLDPEKGGLKVETSTLPRALTSLTCKASYRMSDMPSRPHHTGSSQTKLSHQVPERPLQRTADRCESSEKSKGKAQKRQANRRRANYPPGKARSPGEEPPSDGTSWQASKADPQTKLSQMPSSTTEPGRAT